jgi:chromosome segregation ATPase
VNAGIRHFTAEDPMADEMTVLRDRQDKLEGRVTVLEGRVTVLKASIEREAALRAKMDEDQSNITATLNAHGRSLQALHDAQQDHTRRLTRMEGDLGDVKEDLGTVKIGVHAILDLLDTHLARKPRLSVAGLLRRARK